jgi:signal peptidase I
MLRGVFKLSIILVIVAAAIVGVSRFFFVDIAEVGHNGMAPTLVAGDVVLILRNADIDVGDVVICPNPIRKGEFATGRVIARAGSVVQTDRLGQLNVDEHSIYADWRGTINFYNSPAKKHMDMKLGVARIADSEYQIFLEKKSRFRIRQFEVARGVYLLGDNRSKHPYDSRHFGVVDPATCVGQVFMLLQPSPHRGPGIQRSRFSRI